MISKQRFKERMQELAQFDSGWYDDNQGEKLNPEMLETVQQNMIDILGDKALYPFVYPGVHGTLLLEWHGQRVELYLCVFDKDKVNLVFFERKDDGFEFEKLMDLSFKESWLEIKEWVNKFENNN